MKKPRPHTLHFMKYFLKYEGCNEAGQVELALSCDEPVFGNYVRLGTFIYGLRGFSRDSKPCFAYVSETPDEDVSYLPSLENLFHRKSDLSWNEADKLDRFIRMVVTSLHSEPFFSSLEPSFFPPKTEI